MRGDKIVLRQPMRTLLIGYPGHAKTGALASLVNAGYKLRMLDYDGNTQSLLSHIDADKLKNVDIVYIEDRMRNGEKFIETTGVPTAFKRGLDLMDRWKYTEEDGTVVDLGRSKDWGCDTIVALDTMTSMGLASFRRQQSLMNKTPLNTTEQVWGLAMAQEEAFIEQLTSEANKFHVFVLAHLKMIGPKDERKDDSDLTKDLKKRAANLIETRLFPTALGKALPPVIGGHFPAIILSEPHYVGGVFKDYLLHTKPRPELDLKLPTTSKDLDKLSIKDGLAKIFAELAPPLETCREKSADTSSANIEEKKVL